MIALLVKICYRRAAYPIRYSRYKHRQRGIKFRFAAPGVFQIRRQPGQADKEGDITGKILKHSQ